MLSKENMPMNFVAFSNLRGFAKMVNPRFSCEPSHIKRIAQALEDVEAGKIKRLMITIPPRCGKSTLCSELFPAWFLGRNPTKQFIFATYNQSFATDWGRKVRNHMCSDAFKDIFPSTLISDDSAASNRFHTTKGGVYYAVGMDSSITGRGGDILLIDDFIKNKEEADSSLIRQKHKDWFASVAYTRLEPEGAVIIIATRWHNDDLIGWILKENKEKWHKIDLPAISIVDGMEVALWPERYSLDDLHRIQNTLPARDWAALYMQTPVMDGGEVFKAERMQYYEQLSHSSLNNYLFVDPADGERKKKTSDYSSIQVWGCGKDHNLYMVDMWHDRLNMKEREDIIFHAVEKYRVKQVFYEKYSMQLDIGWLKQAMDARNFRFSIEEVGGNQSTKVDRIKRLQPYFEDRKLYFPLALRKNNYMRREIDLIDYLKHEELIPFPYGKHDDALDCMSRICDVEMLYPGANSNFNYHELYKNAR